jgi:hypothetical protein
LLNPSNDYRGYPPAQIYSSFYLKPAEITNLKPGDTIKLHSQQLAYTNSTVYFFKQYQYMKERIMKLREQDRTSKDGAIVTGTPGIGRMHATL